MVDWQSSVTGDEVSTAQLVAAARAGDGDAWEAIVQRHARLLAGVVRGYRLSEADAADVVQVTWLRLVQSLDRIRQPEALAAWLVTTARREAIATLRRRGRERLVGDEGVVEVIDLTGSAAEPGPEARVVDAEDLAVLHRCVDDLPERYQPLMRALMMDPPLSYADISETLGIPLGSIGPTRARCLRRMRHAWQHHDETILEIGP